MNERKLKWIGVCGTCNRDYESDEEVFSCPNCGSDNMTCDEPEGEMVVCPHCKGTGQEFPDCGECAGAGWVEDLDDGGTMTCPDCDNENCSVCDGDLEIYAEKPE